MLINSYKVRTSLSKPTSTQSLSKEKGKTTSHQPGLGLNARLGKHSPLLFGANPQDRKIQELVKQLAETGIKLTPSEKKTFLTIVNANPAIQTKDLVNHDELGIPRTIQRFLCEIYREFGVSEVSELRDPIFRKALFIQIGLKSGLIMLAPDPDKQTYILNPNHVRRK